MCGFAGFIDPTRKYDNTTLVATVERMSAQLIHRGPDDAGVWIDPDNNLALGFRRLSIIETSQAGHQPLVSHDNQFAMVFNGEIYNYLELREQLGKEGCQIESHSDSVVLFRALQHWGVDKTLQLINGMFAVAFWNGHKKQLFLIRDRLGQKPLYYYFDTKMLLFGSELKALIAYPGFKKNLNQKAVSSFLQYAYVCDPLAIYENTYKVKPAEYVSYSCATHTLALHNYWDLEAIVQSKSDTRTEQALEDNMHNKLKQSVKLRMRSDVPFGSFLSGGIDSSLITALMQEQSSDKIKTFSIGFNEAQFDESCYAKKVAAHLGTDHTELFVNAKQAQDVITQLPHIYDEPFADPSQIPTFLLSKLTRKHVTVALSGDGGDESFAGYNRHFWVPNMWRYMGNKPYIIKKVMEGVIKTLRPTQWNKVTGGLLPLLPARFRYQNVGDKLYKLLPFLQAQSPIQVYDKLSSFWHYPDSILKEPAFFTLNSQNLTLNMISDMMYRDTQYYLPGDILTKVDRASMAVSLEVRSPFLDHHVIEAAWRLPMQMKLQGSKGKLILINILGQFVPRELFERSIRGFGVPICDWLRGPLREWGEELLSEQSLKEGGLFNSEIIREYWKAHLSGQRNWQYPLWCILMFQSWRAHYAV